MYRTHLTIFTQLYFMRLRTHVIYLVLCVVAYCAAKAQLQPVFSFQKDDTTVKRKYFNEALQKKNTLISLLNGKTKSDYKQAYDGMFEVVEELLISTRSVTEQTADGYIKAIANRIINSNPELKSLDIRIVFSRDFPPNAFSIGDGTIAFNAGLFTYLDNEAQMAFIISHELAHYYLDHSGQRVAKYVALKNSDSLKKEIRKIIKQEYRVFEQLNKLSKEYAFNSRKYSRDKEEEADNVGLRFLKNSGYDGMAFVTTMELLDKVDDTAFFSPLKLQKILSFPDYPFKERWIKKESSIFSAMNSDEASGLTQKERDSLKTHPDCSKRIALLSGEAQKIKGQHFLVDENLFRKLKQDFVPEIMEEIYRQGNIGYHLYQSLRMLQDNKYIPLAVYSITRDLNRLYEYQKNHELGLIIDTESRYSTENYNEFLRMLYRLRLNEIAELNTAFCFAYKNQMAGYEGFAAEMTKAVRYKSSHDN